MPVFQQSINYVELPGTCNGLDVHMWVVVTVQLGHSNLPISSKWFLLLSSSAASTMLQQKSASSYSELPNWM